jgi:hypothetical protein
VKPVLPQKSSADAVGKLLQMLENLLDPPTAAEIVTDNAVKQVAAIGTDRSAVAHDLFNFIDAVLRSAAVEAVAVDRGGCFCGCCLAAFPQTRPQLISPSISVSSRTVSSL